jgi:primosomal protein N' (replication factor Y)
VERREASWPPYSHLAAFRADATERDPAFALLNRVRAIAGRIAAADVAILGPAPEPMERKEGRYRAQLLFRSAQRAPLHELLRRTLLDLRGAPETRRARLALDVDPLEL